MLHGGGIIELPFGPGKRFGKDTSGAIARLIGGWTVTASLVYELSSPSRISGAMNALQDAESYQGILSKG